MSDRRAGPNPLDSLTEALAEAARLVEEAGGAEAQRLLGAIDSARRVLRTATDTLMTAPPESRVLQAPRIGLNAQSKGNLFGRGRGLR